MGTLELLLCVFVGHFVPVCSVIKQDALFSPALPGFFDNIKRHFDFPPYDTIFGSRGTRSPDFQMLAELPPIMTAPEVQVSCDDSQLTVLVDKKFYGGTLNREDIRLGDGCYSNGELPDQFVLTYSFDQCGTTPKLCNGLERFENVLHLNLQKSLSTRWITPTTIYISCLPTRSYPNFFASAALPEKVGGVALKAMNPSWTSTAESNVYERGQVVNLQVSGAGTRAGRQLYVQSCYVSGSPEPQARPKHAVILNKGCTAPLGSPHAIVEFVASNRADVVNVALNTSYLISEMYVHCSVLLSDRGVTTGSKSCNYNLVRSRWEELNGNVEVCSCCSSKCKGLSVKHLSDGAKALVSTGPFIIVNKAEMNPQLSVSRLQGPSNKLVTDSDAAVPDSKIASDTSVPSKFSESLGSSPQQGVVVVNQDADGRVTVWLPGQVQDTERSGNTGSQNELPQLQPSTTDQEFVLKMPTNEIREESPNKAPVLDLNVVMLLDGWSIPLELGKVAVAEESPNKLAEAPVLDLNAIMMLDGGAVPEESKRKKQFRGSEMFATVLPAEIKSDLNQNVNQLSDEPAQRLMDAAIMHQDSLNVQPAIRSKVQFTKGTDGSQTLSYEEEMVPKHEGTGALKSFGMARIENEQKGGLRSTFLDLLRSMDKGE